MRPGTEEELAGLVADHAAAGKAIAVQGGGSRTGLGGAVAGDMLETGGLSGIRLYEPGALTIVAGAGTPLAEVEAALATEGQMLPFEPMDHRGIYGTSGAPTIGGVVATGASGPRRIQAGACRDSLIGVRAVTGEGVVIKNGGRVMKNVTGYDLVKLMAGSHGTLGVLTEVAFKVLPKPEAVATLTLEGLSATKAVEAMSMALTSPFDVNGAAHVASGKTYIRIEGFEASVKYRSKQLTEKLSSFGEVSIDSSGDVWGAIRDAKHVAGEGDIWRVSVKPSDGPEVLSRIDAEAAILDWGGGLVWARVRSGYDLRAKLGGIAGHVTLFRGSDKTKTDLGVFHPEPEPLARLSQGLRAKFDPKGILNPGRMG